MYLLGPRILVRDFEYADEDDLYELCSNEKIGYNAGWKPHSSMRDTRNILSGYLYSKETFAIQLRENSKVIGTISLYSETFRKRVNAYDIGFSLNEKYWGNGYMQEALQLMLEYAFYQKKADIIGIGHHLDNQRSKYTIMQSGFKFEGIIRKYKKLYDGRIIDAAIYSMTKEEYEEDKI